MPIQFPIESIDFLAEKISDCRSLSDESLVYLTSETSGVIFDFLQDAFKAVRKCRRKDMTTDDFAFAIKLHRVEPIYGNYTASSVHHPLFRKAKKDHRILYQMDDNIIPLEHLLTSPPSIPVDINIRAHWLAVKGTQPLTNENPLINPPLQSTRHCTSQNKRNPISHILSTEQQIYYKELTEMCICSDEHKRKQAFVILSSDDTLQQIISRLVLFISEGVRVNFSPTSPFDRSILLNILMQMTDALLHNDGLCLTSYIHYLLPAVLSCLLERRTSSEHWTLRHLAAKCCGQTIRNYATAANRLQQRTIDVFYGILSKDDAEYTWPTRYGAFIGLCEMGHKVIIQIAFPLVRRLGETIPLILDAEVAQKFTETIVKSISLAYRSDQRNNEKKLYEDFGAYFAPLIQHELILLL